MEAIMKSFNFNLDKYLKELEFLVNTDSGSYDFEGTKKVGDYFEKIYKELGWTVKSFNFDDRIGPCLEIRNIDSEEIDILLVGHMDTVFSKGTSESRPFTIKEDKAYGPGVADMKSGLLSMYYTLKSLNLSDFKMRPSICVALNSDEEIGSIFSCEWIKKLASKSKYAFVLEPGRKNGDLVNERKGVFKYNIELIGVASHAGVEPEKGISAISELAYWIIELNKLTNLEIGTTINTGIISGGTAANVVAKEANAVVDVRYKHQNEIIKIENSIKNLLQHSKFVGIKPNVNRSGFRPPMNPTEDSKKLFEIIDNVGEKLNMDFNWAATGGGSDANFIAAEGVPTADALGPIGGGTHGADEYIEINSIEFRFKLLREVIIRILNLTENDKIEL
jgi:glutamate carboxypeptidase